MARISELVRNKGETPAIRVHPHQEWREYAVEFGWDKWRSLSEDEQAQYIATRRTTKDQEFVSSYWHLYGNAAVPPEDDDDEDELE